MFYGDLGKRIVAMIIDSVVLSAISFVLFICLGFAALIIVPIVMWLYYILMEGGGWHATLGKRVMGLYIADINGFGISYSTAILRLIGKMFSGLIVGIGYLIAFFNEEKQALHDMIAKTYVMEDRYQEASVGFEREENYPELIGVNGPLAGMTYNICDAGLVIGRDSLGCQVVIPSSQTKISRIHCYVTYNSISGMFVLSDRNSTHGTFLANGRRISHTHPVALKSGDRFYLATPENTFELR